MNLFAYGTLMFPEVWAKVVGREHPASQPAVLSGYAAYRAAGDVYPVLMAADPAVRTEGVVYFDLDAATVLKLDSYESVLYERRRIEPLLDDGRSIACEAYVLPERNSRHASSVPWDRGRFEREHLRDYLRNMASASRDDR